MLVKFLFSVYIFFLLLRDLMSYRNKDSSFLSERLEEDTECFSRQDSLGKLNKMHLLIYNSIINFVSI